MQKSSKGARWPINDGNRRKAIREEATGPKTRSGESMDVYAGHGSQVGRLAVVLPAYNEQDVIERTITDVMTKLPQLVSDFMVIPVDDGSTDSTRQILDRLAQRYGPRLSVVHNVVNQSYGGALRAGFERALTSDAEYIFFMDADGQFDIGDLRGFLPLLGTCDAVFGYRLERKDSMIRRCNAWAWKQLVSMVFGFRVRDIDCAFKLFRADFIRSARLQMHGAMINTELLARFAQARLRFVEVGVHHYPRTSGTPTGANPAVIARAFRELVTLRRQMHDELRATGVTSAHAGWHAAGAAPGERHWHPSDVPRVLSHLRQVMRAPLPSWLTFSAMALLVVTSLFLHLQAAKTTTGALYDIDSYRFQAASVFQHRNVYIATERYPYPPVWVWIVASVQWIASTQHMRFDVLVKLPAILADLGIVILIYRYVRDRRGACLAALLAAALYALNPVAVLVTAGHGQFDALAIFFVLLALQLRGVNQDRRVVWSAIALGVAISLKGYPVLLLPYLVLTAPRGKRLISGGLALAPLAACSLLYVALFGFTPLMVTRVLNYNGTGQFGWLALIQGTQYAALVTPDFASRASTISHALIVLFALVMPWWRYRTQPATVAALIFLAFYAMTATMSVQYVIWALPFVVIAMPIGAIVYSVAAMVGAVAFYPGLYQSAIPHVSYWESMFLLLAPYRTNGVAAIIFVSGALVAAQLGWSLLRQHPRTEYVGGHFFSRAASPVRDMAELIDFAPGQAGGSDQGLRNDTGPILAPSDAEP